MIMAAAVLRLLVAAAVPPGRLFSVAGYFVLRGLSLPPRLFPPFFAINP